MFHQFKIVMLGEEMVGKTSIRIQYTNGLFSQNYLKTYGADVSYKKIEESKTISNVSIWDLDGNRDFSFLRQYYLTGANGIVFVLDSTRQFNQEAIKGWIEDLKNSVVYRKFSVALLINKIDLKDQISIDSSEILIIKQLLHDEFDNSTELFANLKVKIFLTSAKTGEGISNAFQWIIQNAVSHLTGVHEHAY